MKDSGNLGCNKITWMDWGVFTKNCMVGNFLPLEEEGISSFEIRGITDLLKFWLTDFAMVLVLLSFLLVGTLNNFLELWISRL